MSGEIAIVLLLLLVGVVFFMMRGSSDDSSRADDEQESQPSQVDSKQPDEEPAEQTPSLEVQDTDDRKPSETQPDPVVVQPVEIEIPVFQEPIEPVREPEPIRIPDSIRPVPESFRPVPESLRPVPESLRPVPDSKLPTIEIELPHIEAVKEISVPKIFIVDDSIVVRTKLSRLVAGAGYDIVAFNDGVSVMKQIESELPSLIITDIEMPEMNGFEVIERLYTSKRTVNLPVIAISGHDGVGKQLKDFPNAVATFKKPWDAEALLGKISELVGPGTPA